MRLGTVIHRFAETAKFFPERAALFTGGRHYTYRELAALAQGIRNGLVESGFVGAGRIGLLNGTDACTYASVLAILAHGAAYVPLDERNSRGRNRRIIEDAELDVVLVSGSQEAAGLIDAALPGDIEVMRTLAADSDSRSSTGLDVAEITADALAYLTYSFDEAERPIGVPTYHRNLNSFFSALLDPRICDFGRDDRFLQAFELREDRALAPLFAALSVGACCYVATSQPAIEGMLFEQNLTVAMMAPAPAVDCRTELTSLRHSFFYGPVVPAPFIEQWIERAPNSRIQTVYGRAEATVYCLRRTWQPGPSRHDAENAFAIGTPLPRMEAIIVDADNRRVAAGQAGVLCLRGAQVSGHYWNEPAHAAEAFVDVGDADAKARAWRTGDICSMDEQGELVFLRAAHDL